MRLKVFSVVFVLAYSSVTGVFSQNTNTVDPRDTRPEYMKDVDRGRARQDENNRKAIEQSRVVMNKRGSPVSAEEIEEYRKAAELQKVEALEEINKLLSTPREYEVKYAEFLKEKNAGIARIFPDRSCDKGIVVSVKDLERCSGTAPIWGAGSLYSFRLYKLPSDLNLGQIHHFIRSSDIHFINGKFEVGTESILDIISDIGDVELAEVSLRSDTIKFLRSFEPGGSRKTVARQRQELEKGIDVNGFVYSTSAEVAPDRTYVLRSIAFNRSDQASLMSGYYFWNTDVISVFRVVGREDDGSVILVWKELKESRAPFIR